jgi:ribosomal protein S18 acetylase RimI-like enzyme
MFFGVLPQFRGLGADSLLFTEIHAHAQRRGYRQADVSLLLEVNRRIARAAEALGGVRTKTWRIFDLTL